MALFNKEPPSRANFSTKDPQGPPIYVGNATVIGYNHAVEYFGSDIGFKKTVNLDLRCTLTDINNKEGAAPGVESFLTFLNTSQDYSNLYINGMLQEGTAKVVSFSVDSGDMVNEAECSISFLIHQTYEDIALLSGSTYYKDYASALPADANFAQILDSFTDSISLSRSDNSTSYNRNISISANKSLNIVDLGDEIRRFVRDVLAFTTFSFPDLSSFDPEINALAESNTFKKYITETSDETENIYSFQESLQTSNVVGNYSAVITQNYSRAGNGVESVTENGSIMGLLESSRIAAAEAGYNAEMGKASDRMKAFYNKVRLCNAKDGDGNCTENASANLNTRSDGGLLFITRGKSTDTYEGTITYTLATNNDPHYKDGNGERWEYNLNLENDGVYETATEQGTINGAGYVKYNSVGHFSSLLGRYPKYQSAKTFFVDEVLASSGAVLNGRITGLINATTFSVSPKPTRRTQGHAPRQGVISYSRSFSNNPIYQLNDATNRIKKIESNNTLNATVPIVHNFISLSNSEDIFFRGGGFLNGDNRHIVQKQSTESLSTVSNSITSVCYRINVDDERTQLNRIGNISKSKIDLLDKMDGDTVWLNSASFSFSSLNDVIFSLNTSYNKGIGSC